MGASSADAPPWVTLRDPCAGSRAMSSSLCHFHLATEIHRARAGRAPVLCETLVPDDAATCQGCGFPAPRVRLYGAVENYRRDPHQGGDVEATVARMRA